MTETAQVRPAGGAPRMDRSFAQAWATTIGGLIIGLLYTAASLFLYAYHPGFMPVPPVAWLLLLGGGGVLLVLFHRNWKVLWATGIPVWSMLYIAVGAWGFLLAGDRGAAAQELGYMLLTVFLITGFILVNAEEGVQRRLAPLLVAAVLLAVLFNMVDVVRPGAFSASFGRAAGMYVNPNISALAITSGMIAAIGWIPPKRRAALVVLAGLGVFVTFSRGGILVFIVAAGVLLHGRIAPAGGVAKRIAFLVIAGALLLPLTTTGQAILDSGGAVQQKLLRRILSVEAVAQTDQSYSSREKVARHALNTFADHPFVGGGLGATRTWELSEDTHNIYLKQLAVFGLAGVVLFPAFAFLVGVGGSGETRTIGRAFCAALLVSGLVSHNVLEDRAGLFCAAFVAAMVARQRLGRWAR